MKFGIYLPNFGPYGDARTLADLALDAEKSGWDGFFIWDHVAGWTLPIVDPWVALAAVAMNTRRIRLGTTVTPLPRRRPWKLARETVSLDHLSGGRLTLGVGIGLGEDEWDHLGEEPDQKKRGAMLDEALSVLIGLWSGEPFTYQGQYYHIDKAHFLPRPVQQPRIPIWVGGVWPNKAPFRRAAKWDGVFPIIQEEEDAAELAQIEALIAYCQKHRPGEEPFDVVFMGITTGRDPAEASALVQHRAALGVTWWLEIIAPYAFGQGLEGEWPVDALRERVLEGPPITL